MEEKKLPEDGGNQEEPKKGTSLSRRSCILYLIAGVYLIYTGFTLIKGKVTGVETATWGTAIFGGVFIIAAAVMIVVALRALKVLESQNKEESEGSGEKDAQESGTAECTVNGTEDVKPQKPLSIAERARLVSDLGDNGTDTETSEEPGEEES